MGKRDILFRLTAKDFKVEAMRSSKGAGGQKRDKTSSAIRITHEPSGAVGFSQEYREQHKNKKLAFKRMVESPKFQIWVRMNASGLRPVDEIVDELIAAENIKVEVKDGGKWKSK